MADKFGAAMALVKSDIGGNISVCFCHLFYLTCYFFLYVCVITCLHAALDVIFFILRRHAMVIWLGHALKRKLGVDSFLKNSCVADL